MSIATAAGLAVLIVGLFAWLRADMGRMETRLNTRIGGVESGLGARIDGVEAGLNARMDGVKTDLNAGIDGVKTELNARIDGVGANLASRIERVEQGNMDLRECMARIEGMLDGLRDSITGRDRRDAA